jgi:hypothetical protein
MADWLGSSEQTLRRVITLSTQTESPKSTVMLRSLARVDVNTIEPFVTSSKNSKHKVVDESSEESSEFVDIDFDGLRFQENAKMKEEEMLSRARTGGEEEDQESEYETIDESEERQAIAELKAFSKK